MFYINIAVVHFVKFFCFVLFCFVFLGGGGGGGGGKRLPHVNFMGISFHMQG